MTTIRPDDDVNAGRQVQTQEWTHIIRLLRFLHDKLPDHGGAEFHQIGEDVGSCCSHLQVVHPLKKKQQQQMVEDRTFPASEYCKTMNWKLPRLNGVCTPAELRTHHDNLESWQDAKVGQGFEEGVPVLWLQRL